MKSSAYWDDRALRRLKEAEKHSDKYIKRVKSIYNQAYRDIDKQLASVYRNYSKETGLDVAKLKELLTRSETKKTWEEMKRQGLDKYIKSNYKSRISRLEQLQAQIYAKAKKVYPKEELENTMCYKGVINQSYYKTMYDTQMGTGYNFNFSTIDDNIVESLLKERWSGKNYSERIWGNTDILADSVSKIVGGALLSGQGVELTSKQIRDRFNVSKYYAERLIRTETNHFNNEVDAMAYEEMGLDKYVFVATLDSRTSEICQSMDNKVFKFKEREEGVNYPPLHPNCRSKTRAYLGKEEEKELQRRAKNPLTGETEIIPNMSYKEWLKKVSQDESVSVNKVKVAIKMNQNKNIDTEQYNRYINRLGKNTIGDFDNYQKIKYTDKKKWNELQYTYKLKRHYDTSINNGDLSALVDFDLYKKMDKKLNTELNNITTANDITINGHTLHFIDRVCGSIEQKRNGVDIKDIKDTLKTYTKKKEQDKSIKLYGKNNIVSINPITSKLIQVNPY